MIDRREARGRAAPERSPRRALAAAALATSAIVVLVLALGCGDGDSAAQTAPRPAATPGLAGLVGQRLMVGLREPEPPPRLLADVRAGRVGAVVAFTEESSPADVRRAAARLRAAAAAGGQPPLLLATDQEGGAVKRLPGPPRRPLSLLSPAAARAEGARTGIYLRAHGIDVDLAPVVDLGLPGFIAAQGRTISASPARVAAVAAGFVAGLDSARVMAVAKHFPGLGGAAVNSDEGRSAVTAPLGPALLPYRRLITAGLPAVMASTAFYPRLDVVRAAAWSPAIVTGLLRRRLGFRGLVLTDELSSAGVRQSLSTPRAAVAAARAGADLLMIESEDLRATRRALLVAGRSGHLAEDELIASYRRIVAAKRRFGG